MKKWLIALAAVVSLPVVAGALLWLFRNPLADYALTRGAEALVGAEVSVEGVKAGPFSLELAWERLVVADARDPWKNLVETGPGRLTLAGPPLLKGCLKVESLTTGGVVVGGARRMKARVTDPSSVAGTPSDRLSLWLRRQLEEEAKELPGLAMVDRGSPETVRGVMGAVSFQTPAQVDRARADMQARSARWQWHLRGRDYKKRLTAIAEALEGEDPAAAETMEVLSAMAERGQGLKKELEILGDELAKEKATAEAELSRLGRWTAAYPGWVARDVEAARGMVRPGEPGLQDLGETLFSYHLARLTVPAVEGLESLGALVCALKEDEGLKAAGPCPKLWIDRAGVAMDMGAFSMSGTAEGLSSHRPQGEGALTFDLEGEALSESGQLKVTGRAGCPGDACDQGGIIHAQGVPAEEVILAPGVHLTQGVADVRMAYRMLGQEARVETLVTLTGATVTGDGGGLGWLRQALEESLARVPFLEVRAVMTFDGGQGRWELESNLDAYLAVRFDEAVARESERVAQGLKEEVERRLRRHGVLLEEELAVAQQRMMSPVAFLEESLGRETLAVDRFLAGVEKERAKRQQEIEEKGMDALMKWKY